MVKCTADFFLFWMKQLLSLANNLKVYSAPKHFFKGHKKKLQIHFFTYIQMPTMLL